MTSPDSSGNAGVHFEAQVASHYLSAVLCEAPARGLIAQRAIEVRTQRADFDHPLDDIVITGIIENGRETRLDLQITRRLTFTENDGKWTDILRRAWDTFSSEGFDPTVDRIGAGISVYNAKVDSDYQSVLNWATYSSSGDDFVERIGKEDFSNANKRAFVQTVRNVLTAHVGRGLSNDELWGLLRCFVIIHFDFQSQQTSRDEAYTIERLQSLFAPEQRAQARRIWEHLITETGQLIPVGGSADRAILAERLTAEGLPVGTAPSFWKDIQTIHRESQRALSDIRSDMHGLTIHRADSHWQTRDALTLTDSGSRLIQIVGEPGVGKSALLKEIAKECARIGPLFTLDDGRIHPRGWSAHAHVLKVSDDMPALLREFACSGVAILFIDGIDKITDPAIQLTVNDLVRAIANNEQLSDWRILVSVRQQNLEHLENWLDPDALRKLPLKTITVETLGKEELRVVAERFPRLRPLLSRSGGMEAVLKRPFFLSALLSFTRDTDAVDLPATEVDLLNLWWRLGGIEHQDSFAQHRRNTLIKLAGHVARSPNMPIPIGDAAPEHVEKLQSSGVIRDKDLGHSVVFTHDIYEEWALCQLLIRHGANIGAFLTEIGEPSVLIRPMQLLGEYTLKTDSMDEWQGLHEKTGDPALRPVWRQAILTSCLQSTRATRILEELTDCLLTGEYEQFKKLLVAIGTIEVIPNPLYLNETLTPDLEPEDRAKIAHHAALPKRSTWIRFLDWLMPRMETLPPSLIPDLLPVLTTWQNAFAAFSEIKIQHCREIGEISYRWLMEFEDACHPPRFDQWRAPFGIDSLRYNDENIEKKLHQLFLFSAGHVPELAKEYLQAKAADRAHRDMFRMEILENCGALIRYLPAELVDFILEAFLEHPDDENVKVKSKKIDGRLTLQGDKDFGFVESLGLADFYQFVSASPIQTPFLGLLRQHESQGLRLIHALCNHSISIRRWMDTKDQYRHLGTPLPINLAFPWGEQTFWGDGHIYQWFRGISIWNNKFVESALMALEQWALEKIHQGAEFEEIFRKVIQGNDSVAVLGIGVSLCLAYPEKSIECALPLVTCPYLWNWDIARCMEDTNTSPLNELAIFRHHLELNAVRALNRKEHRKQDIRNLIPYFVFWHDRKLTERYTQGIGRFPENLPFEYEEQKNDSDLVSKLRERMVTYSEQGDPENWRAASTGNDGQTMIWSEPPYLKSEKYQTFQQEHSHLNECLGLALWGRKSLEDGKVDEHFSVEQGLAKAKELDSEELFKQYQGPENLTDNHRASGVAGAAFVVARFCTAEKWNDRIGAWCLDVLDRAAGMVEAKDGSHFRGAVLLDHPTIFAAHGYSALLALGYETTHCKYALLNLTVDALEGVVEAVFASASLYATKESEFYWILFDLGIRQCIMSRHEIPDDLSSQWEHQEAAHKLALIERAERCMETGSEPELPDIPMPWVKTDVKAPGARRPRPQRRRHSIRLPIVTPQTVATEDVSSPKDEAEDFHRNDTVFLYHLAGKVVLQTCLDAVLSVPDKQARFIALVGQLLDYAIQEPEWVFEFSHWCGKICAHLPEDDVRGEILARIFATDDETALLIMHLLMPSFMFEALLKPTKVSGSSMNLWGEMTDWVFDNPTWRHPRTDRHLGREFEACASTTLFCAISGLSSLGCAIQPGWPNLEKFRPIIERAIREFGTHKNLYWVVMKFLKKGGLDFLPEPALPWLRDIALAKKQDKDFWGSNGDATVEVVKMMIEKRGNLLQPIHRKTINLILDILIDSGVREAGFLRQKLLRA